MPKETYYDRAERDEVCKCRVPKGDSICLNCSGKIVGGDKIDDKVQGET